jgi:bacillithiol biosynthesis cysteine-adding enzyme BshC
MDNSSCINYSKTGAFSKLFLNYVDGSEELKKFYIHAPNVNSIGNAIENKSKENINRKVLVEQINSQYKSIDLHERVRTNIELLNQTNTYTITTGHQLSIFTGEWYFIFKIITAINLAKEAKEKFPEYNFVPVFWMASEDHDFEEINHVYLKNERFTWNEHAKGPVGRLSSEKLVEQVHSIAHFLKGTKHAEELIQIFQKAYTKEHTLAEATRILVNELFQDEGLVILDADSRALKKVWSSSIKKELLTNENYDACKESTEALEALGYSAQIHAREINLFYLMDGFRERIVKENNEYSTVEGSYKFTKDEIFTEVENTPERFSPNVVLRPLYQESILPNLCYVGGPGEIAYWLQLQKVFEVNNVSFPLLAWRNSFMILEEKDSKAWQALSFEISDFFQSIPSLEKKYVEKHQTEKINFKEEEKILDTYIDAVKTKARRVDENLQYSINGIEKRISNMMLRMEHKIWKAEKRKYKTELNKIERLKTKYFPEGKLQERKENFSLWYANCGKEGMNRLKVASKPLINELIILKFD